MKTLLLFALSIPAFAGDLYQHISVPLLDAYIDSAVAADPKIPGLGNSHYSIAISLSTMDAQASSFSVYLRVRLEDGTEHPIKALVERAGFNDDPTTVRFPLGCIKPTKVVAFYVIRNHPESSDQLIH